jgi:hypothetical protein
MFPGLVEQVYSKRHLSWRLLLLCRADQDRAMGKTFKIGDHVSWNSEAGRVRGKIVKVDVRDVNYKGGSKKPASGIGPC